MNIVLLDRLLRHADSDPSGALIGAENADRQFIYDELMRQNSIPADQAGRVRAAFARANQHRAQAGEWIQLDNGQWARK